MAMIPGTTSALPGTMSGELYAALDGIDADVDADEFRRALCAAFGLAIATHANDTLVSGSAGQVATVAQHFGYNAEATSAFRVLPVFGGAAGTTTAANVCRMYFRQPGRVVGMYARSSSSMGSTEVRLYRNGSQISSDTQTLGTGGAAFDISGDFTAGQFATIGFIPTNNHGLVTAEVTFEYDL
jgi:hypothetical protein